MPFRYSNIQSFQMEGFQGLSHILKSGEEILIREARVEDAPKLIALTKGYIEGTDTIPLYEDEFDPTLEYEEKWINNFIRQNNSLLLLAEFNGELIGNIDLSGNQRRKLYHTAMIGMGISEKWRSKGVGTVLMDAAIKWAEKNPYLDILWLQVYDTNIAGITLYKKMGFEITGQQEGMFREKDGSEVDSLMMTKYLV